MSEKQDSARTTVILAVSTVLLGFYVLTFGLQTLISFEAHRWALTSPFLQAVPRPLPTSVASAIQEKNLAFYGIEFAAPWKGVAKRTEGDAQSEVDFQPGAVIVFFNPASEPDIVGRIRGGDPQIYSHYEAIFGSGFFRDNYSLYSAVYGAAPGEIWPFTSRSEAIRINSLLMWKLRLGVNGANSIYSVETVQMHGFQLGDPSKDRSVVVHLFEENGGQVRILFTSKSGQPGTISQADINCVVDSLRPIPTLH
jgi:hypothetical protein